MVEGCKSLLEPELPQEWVTLPLNSPDQTPHIRPTFVQVDQYFKPNQYLQYFQDNIVQYMAIISTQMIISTVDQSFQGRSL